MFKPEDFYTKGPDGSLRPALLKPEVAAEIVNDLVGQDHWLEKIRVCKKHLDYNPNGKLDEHYCLYCTRIFKKWIKHKWFRWLIGFNL